MPHLTRPHIILGKGFTNAIFRPELISNVAGLGTTCDCKIPLTFPSALREVTFPFDSFWALPPTLPSAFR